MQRYKRAVTIWLNEEDYKLLEKNARNKLTTLSQYLRTILLMYLEGLRTEVK